MGATPVRLGVGATAVRSTRAEQAPARKPWSEADTPGTPLVLPCHSPGTLLLHCWAPARSPRALQTLTLTLTLTLTPTLALTLSLTLARGQPCASSREGLCSRPLGGALVRWVGRVG